MNFKVGMTNYISNGRVDSELMETLASARTRIMKMSGGDIPYLCVSTATKSMKEIESELFELLVDRYDAVRLGEKEHFTRITLDEIKSCMEELRVTNGGQWKSYKELEIDYLTPEFDTYAIKKGPKYGTSDSFHQSRADQFLEKTVGEIRNGNYTGRPR